MVGRGAAKEKDPVPNPVEMIYSTQNLNSRSIKPGESLASPGIRSRPKRPPFLPGPNLSTHLIMGTVSPTTGKLGKILQC